MDIGGYFNPDQQQPMQGELQQSQPQQQQQPEQQQQQQLQEMQCDTVPIPSNGYVEESFDLNSANGMISNDLPMQTAIPLPAPPSQAKSQMQNSPRPTTTAATTAGDIDIDALLLQQFSCLGTTDHDDLISQFQTLLNNQMSRDSARFYLEMSNWNLQTAVCCYLDYCNYQPIPSMKIVDQSRPNSMQQAFRLQNDGTEDWPNGCYLKSTSQQQQITLPALKAGETCDILADIPPTQPAIMWRLCTPNGWYFGEPIWMLPNTADDSPTELAERLSQLRTNTTTNGGHDTTMVPEINVVISVNME